MPVPSGLASLSQTASSNSPAGSDNVFPSLDDYLREIFADLARIRDGVHYILATVSGTDTITAANAQFTSFNAGQVFSFISAGANTTTTVTLNINSIGAKPVLRPGGGAMAIGDIPASGIVLVGYDGTNLTHLNSKHAAFADSATSATSATSAAFATVAGGSLIGVRVFTSSATYTPTTGTNSVIVEAVGGGGGGGGTINCGAGVYSISQSGGGGTYAASRFTSSFSGVAITIGAGGAAGTGGATPTSGGDGGQTSFGSLLTCPGGQGGIWNSTVASGGAFQQIGTLGGGAAGGTPGANILQIQGGPAGAPWTTGGLGRVGGSGASYFGQGLGECLAGNTSGASATEHGVGGMGAFTVASSSGLNGGSGGPGIVIVYEYA